MGTNYVPIELGLIEEGRVAADLDHELRSAARAIAHHVRTWGDKAIGADAIVTLKVKFKAEKEEGAFSIKTSLKSAHPVRPSATSLAIESMDDDGQRTLFVRRTGSDNENPRQRILMTGNGSVVDVKTGEVLEAE